MDKKIRKAVRTYLIKDNKIVVINYKNHDTGYYDIPGGKIEENETPEETSIREFKEETGITEYALSAILASRDKEKVEEISIKSKSGRRLAYLGYEEDVNLCVKSNISENVGIYKDGKITLYNSKS